MENQKYNIDTDFKLRPFSDRDYAGFVEMKNIIYPDHPWSVETFRHRDKTREKKIKYRCWVWEKNKNIVVSAVHTQYTESYHPHRFVIDICVHPDLQGQGYGAACYSHLMEKLEPFDPIKLMSEVHEPHERGIRFMEDRGFVQTHKERESSLDLRHYVPGQHQSELDRVLQKNFQITNLTEFRKVDDNADYKVWELERDVCPDIPWTDPFTMPEYTTYKKHTLLHPKFNPDSWFFVLDGTRIAGMNNLWKSEIKNGINTGLTGVRREYRRKGIASALKHTSLRWSKNQGYEWIRTDNGSTNTGMLSINLRAGFKFMPAWLVFEKIIKEEE